MNNTPAPHTELSRSEMVPARLRAALAAKDLSVSAAARILGWKQPNFHRQTKGQVPLSVVQMEWIEERLGIPMAYLLSYTDELPSFSRRLRSVSNTDPANPIFNDGTGNPKATGPDQSFLRDSNPWPFHYKQQSNDTEAVARVYSFRPRSTQAVKTFDEEAQIVPFPVVDCL